MNPYSAQIVFSHILGLAGVLPDDEGLVQTRVLVLLRGGHARREEVQQAVAAAAMHAGMKTSHLDRTSFYSADKRHASVIFMNTEKAEYVMPVIPTLTLSSAVLDASLDLTELVPLITARCGLFPSAAACIQNAAWRVMTTKELS